MTGRLATVFNRNQSRYSGQTLWTVIILCFAGFLLLSVHPARAKDANNPIRIGAVYSQTGSNAHAHAPSVAGVRLAVKVANGQGGVLGRPVEVTVFDSRSMPIGAKKAAEDAVNSGVVGIIGPSWTNHALAAAEVAQRHHVPLISCHATHPKVTQVGPYIFRVCFTDTFQGRVMARFARLDLGLSRVAILRDITSDYSMFLARIFRREYANLGGTLTVEVDYKPNQTMYDQEVQQLKASDPEGVFIPGHHESGLLARVCQEHGAGSVYLGGDGWTPGSFLRMGGSKIGRGYYCTAWSRELTHEISKRFVARHGHRDDLNASLVLSYDATSVLINAIKRAGQTDRQKVREALADTRGFKGVSGNITFDHNGDPVKGAVIMAVENGRVRFLKHISPE
jgi:branched-chain amino acid transport system substrate-binding protein